MTECHNLAVECQLLAANLDKKNRALHESEARYNLAVQSSGIGIWDWDITTDAFYLSPGFTCKLGVTTTDKITLTYFKAFEESLHREDRFRVLHEIQHHLKSKESYDTEYRLKNTEGEYFWVRARGQAIWDKHGKAQRMTGILDSISKLKNEEEVIRQLYHITLNNNISCTEKINLLLDLGRKYFGTSLAILSRIAGSKYYIQDVSSSDNLKPGQCFDLAQTYCIHTFGSSDVKAWDHAGMSEIATHPSYQTLGVESYIGTTVFVDNTPYGTIHFSDVQKRSKHFTEREKSFITLLAHWLGSELTREHYAQEKSHFIENLKNMNEELEQFSYIASHDLKEPVRTLNTFAQYLLEDVKSQKTERIAEDIEYIQSASSRITNLIDDILELSRIGNTPINKTQTSILSIISDVQDRLNTQILETNTQFNLQLNVDSFYVDPVSLGLVIQNIIQNAIKFQHTGHSPCIDIKSEVSPDGKGIHLHIQDNGIGIKANLQKQIFGIFKKLHSHSKYPGTGIGLAIVMKTIQRHGGKIHVSSIENKGSCFTLFLPHE